MTTGLNYRVKIKHSFREFLAGYKKGYNDIRKDIRNWQDIRKTP